MTGEELQEGKLALANSHLSPPVRVPSFKSLVISSMDCPMEEEEAEVWDWGA